MFNKRNATEAGAAGKEDAGALSGKPEKRVGSEKRPARTPSFGVTRYPTKTTEEFKGAGFFLLQFLDLPPF